MAENPIKLFATRSERYPELTPGDIALGTGRAALAAIPFVGGSITEVLSLVLAPAVTRRRDTWLKELADGLEEAERKIDGFTVESLTQDEAFVSAVIEATRSAISTHKDEKRDALRNGLLNIALRRSTDEDQQQTFLRYIDELTVWHLRILKCLMDKEAERQFTERNQNLRSGSTSFAWRAERLLMMFPELEEQSALYDQVVLDLYSRGLYPHPGLRGTMTSPPHQQTGTRTDAFLAFISNPIK
jgi:hypothetical protein